MDLHQAKAVHRRWTALLWLCYAPLLLALWVKSESEVLCAAMLLLTLSVFAGTCITRHRVFIAESEFIAASVSKPLMEG